MKKISKKTANIIMAAAIVIIVAAGVFFVGRSNGWADKNDKTAAAVEETITAKKVGTDKKTTSKDNKKKAKINSKADNKEETTTEKASEKQTTTAKEAEQSQTENQGTNQNSNSDNQQTETAKQTETKAPETEKVMTCTVSINCSTILNNMDKLDPAKKSLIPSDGWILYTTVDFTEGETAFDVVQRACNNSGIAIEYRGTQYSAYVEGINNIYEFDCGEQSGWMYNVNGDFPNYGSSSYELSDGDTVAWVYTCTGLGTDVGG